MAQVIKRGVATKLAKYIRDHKSLGVNSKEEFANILAKFFKGEDGFFRDDIFVAIATNKLANDPAIKNPKGNNQWKKL